MIESDALDVRRECHNKVVEVLKQGLVDAPNFEHDWSGWVELTAELVEAVLALDRSKMMELFWYLDGMDPTPEKDAALKVLVPGWGSDTPF